MKGLARPHISAEAVQKYSGELRGLVGECTAFWPELRPGLGEVLERVRGFTGGADAEEDLARGMRGKSGGEVVEEERLKWPSSDPAAVGMFVRQALGELKAVS